MLNQILKWAALAALWAKVKPIFWGTLATVLFILTVNAVHAEFVEFPAKTSSHDEDDATAAAADDEPQRI